MHKRARHIVLTIQIVVVTMVALFLAVGVNGLLAAMLVELTPAAVASPAGDEGDEAKAAPQGAQPANALVYNRNLFNQNAGEAEAPPLEPDGAGEEALEPLDAPLDEPAVASGAPVPTDLQVLLVGTQVASDASWSLAILKDLEATAGNDTAYSRVGNTIKEDATILRIDRKRVYFKRHSRNGQIEYIDIDTTEAELRQRMAEARREDSRKETTPSPSAGDTREPTVSKGPATPSAPTRVASAGGVDPGAIESMGDGTYGIPRDMAEQVRNNPNMLKDPRFGAPPQIQPVYAGGGVSGFRLLGVQPGSVYDKLGLKNGDIIMNVNGQVVDNPQKALAFFDQLGPDQDVGVKVNRRGRHKDLTYRLK